MYAKAGSTATYPNLYTTYPNLYATYPNLYAAHPNLYASHPNLYEADYKSSRCLHSCRTKPILNLLDPDP
jgi:hypothetical protein